MKGFFSTFEEFVKSKNFEKIITLIPKINKAKNMEEVLVVLVSVLSDVSLKLYSQLMTKEAETNWDSFFSSINNEDYKIQTIDSFSSTIVLVRAKYVILMIFCTYFFFRVLTFSMESRKVVS